ncbi:MAG TPA: WS/DGAT domain-containing protein, partial [Candidatus Kryptonia bacterium]|nr:WS/DGAT domain-containing protein [Candidatus Kryptonia bacterium]
GLTGSAQLIKGVWPESQSLGTQILDALRDRIALDLDRARAVAGTLTDTVQHPERFASALQAVRSIVATVGFDSHSPLKRTAGRARRLSGTDLPFADVRALRETLGGAMIDVILTIMARAIGKWYAARRMPMVRELMTLVPVNLRKPEDWAEKANVGNVATGIMVPLPIRIRSPLAMHREIHRRVAEKKADPLSGASPAIAEVLSALPRRLLTWMSESTFGSVDFIVTNVPGILVPRYLAGAEIMAAYPFAPVAMKSPVSVALYGYRDRLFIGLNSDETAMADVETFKLMIRASFEELRAAAGVTRRRSRPAVRAT